jgi:hypothetical protein
MPIDQDAVIELPQDSKGLNKPMKNSQYSTWVELKEPRRVPLDLPSSHKLHRYHHLLAQIHLPAIPYCGIDAQSRTEPLKHCLLHTKVIAKDPRRRVIELVGIGTRELRLRALEQPPLCDGLQAAVPSRTSLAGLL